MGWKQVVQTLGVEVIHALSPQAKGKVQRVGQDYSHTKEDE
jgi:hypothetical protein